jgi:NAD(P)-dependent dehydrogenase (short-subunit alcohol dehydrogenase family)
VVCVDRDAALAEKIAQDVSGVAMQADITDREQTRKVFAAAQVHFGKSFSGVVDIVGVAQIGKLSEQTDESWQRQFDIVLKHALFAIQFGGAALAERGGGSLVFVGSISGIASVANQAAYGTAKAALHHLVRSAAHELGASRLRVNAVAPGFVRTPRLLERLSEKFWSQVSAGNPSRRVAIPADIAGPILFLCSDLADYVTGNVMTLDGGISAVAAIPEFTLDS